MARIVASDAKYFTHLNNDVANTLCELLNKSNSDGKILSAGEVLKRLLDFCLGINYLLTNSILDYKQEKTENPDYEPKTLAEIYNPYSHFYKTKTNLDNLANIILIIRDNIISPINPFTTEECNDFFSYFTKEMCAFHNILHNPRHETTLYLDEKYENNISINMLKLHEASLNLCSQEEEWKKNIQAIREIFLTKKSK